MKSIIFGIIILLLLGCVQDYSPYSIAYAENFIGMKRREALLRLVEIQRDIDVHRGDRVSEFRFKCYRMGDDPIFGAYYGDWAYASNFDVNISFSALRELIGKELRHNVTANAAGSWLCFEYLRPSFHLTFSGAKESLVLWFSGEGIETNQAVVVKEVGP